MADSITFRPTEEQGGFIEGLIASGDYASQSEVIRDGLRLLQEQRARLQLETLRKLIDKGFESGISVSSVDDVMERVIARKRKNSQL